MNTFDYTLVGIFAAYGLIRLFLEPINAFMMWVCRDRSR